jgi:ABC-2 type transport system permease protein
VSPRLFLHVVSMEALRALAYRASFWIRVVLTFAAEVALAWFLWRGVFDASGAREIGGFTFESVVRYAVLAALVSRVLHGADLEGAIAQEIYDGSLSRYRVYPVSLFVFKYAQHVGHLMPTVVQLVLFGGLWLSAGSALGWSGVTLLGALGFVLALALGNLLLFTLAWPVQGVAFWAENVWSLMVAVRFVTGLLGGLMVPLTVFPDAARPWLEALPFRYLYSFPIEILTGTVTTQGWLLGTAATLGWIVALRLLGAWVWRRGSLSYSGAGM